MRSFLVVVVSISFALTSAAFGAGDSDLDRGFPKAEAQRFLVLALRNIHLGKCERSFCAKATPQELKAPPVPIRLAQLALAAGYLSGTAEACGLDSENLYFLPLMAGFRRKEKLNDRQLALLAMVHGLKQVQVQRALAGQTCSPQIKRALEGQKA